MDIAPESIKILLPEKEKQASYDTPTSPQLPALTTVASFCCPEEGHHGEV